MYFHAIHAHVPLLASGMTTQLLLAPYLQEQKAFNQCFDHKELYIKALGSALKEVRCSTRLCPAC